MQCFIATCRLYGGKKREQNGLLFHIGLEQLFERAHIIFLKSTSLFHLFHSFKTIEFQTVKQAKLLYL